MSHKIHIAKINAPSIGAAIGKATKFMKAKDSGDNHPRSIGAFCPTTGEESGHTLSTLNGSPLTEAEVITFARRVRFMEVFGEIPVEVAPWKTPAEIIEGEDPDYLVWLANKEQNHREAQKFVSSVTSSKEEKVYALPMLQAWMNAIAAGNDTISQDHTLNDMVEYVTESIHDYPFSWQGTLYSNRLWDMKEWGFEKKTPDDLIYYVFFDVHD